MRVFVTGVGGQLGHDVMDELARRGIEAVGSDIHETLDTPYAYQQLDITDPDAVRRELTDVLPDAVIHCAAWTAVDAAEDNEEAARKVNVDGTANIAKACADTGARLMYFSYSVLVSTASATLVIFLFKTFASPSTIPLKETVYWQSCLWNISRLPNSMGLISTISPSNMPFSFAISIM